MTRKELQKAINWFGDEEGCNEATKRLLWAARIQLAGMPHTEEVERWHVQYVLDGELMVKVFETQTGAETEAVRMREVRSPVKNIYSCVRVTGPHKHEVPA
jgi:hypothetical protein